MSFPEHHPYHERRLEQQMLDTLLRIEEILARAFPVVAVPPDFSWTEEELQEIEQVKEQTKKPAPAKGKRK